MPVRVEARKDSRRRLDLKCFEKAVAEILRFLGLKNISLNILLTTDKKIKKFHLDYFRDDTTTDVISFPAPQPRKKKASDAYLGDLVISLDTAFRECKKYGNTFSYEVLFYTTHGILHCLGDCDETPEKSARMLRKQTLILKKTGLEHFSLVR